MHTPKVCCNRKRESFNSKEREKASTLGEKRKSFNAREIKKASMLEKIHTHKHKWLGKKKKV